jgi:WD40 repeat protein
MMRWYVVAAVLAGAGLFAPGTAQAQNVSFSKDIVPILKDQCVSCHNTTQPAGGLAVNSFALLTKGGKGGKSFAAKSADSRLVKYLEGILQPKMPIGGSLTRQQIDLVKRWVDQGAKADVEANLLVIPDRAGAPSVDVPKVALRHPVLPQAAALAWSPDGKIVALGTYRTVRLFDAETGGLLRELPDHADVVHSVQFSPDGTLLAAAGGPAAQQGEVKLWNVADGSLVRTIEGHADYIYSCSWSPDGKMLATASYDKLVKLWNVEDGAELKTLKDHADAVYAVAFNPQGNLLATASADRSVKMWEVESGRRLYTLSGHGDIVFTLAWNPNGNQLISAGADKTIRTWNVNAQSGNQARNVTAHDRTVTEAVFSPDGKLLASVGLDRALKLWNAENGQAAHAVSDFKEALLSVVFSPDNSKVAVGGYDGTVRIYNAGEATLISTLVDLPQQASAN